MSAIKPCELKQVIAHLCDYLRQVALRLQNPHFGVIWSHHTQGHCFQLQFQITGNFPFFSDIQIGPAYIYHLPMQAFKERQIKPYRYRNCLKSFKNSNALKYHLDKMNSNEANRMEMANTSEMEGKLRIIFTQFPLYITSFCLVKATSDVCFE